MSSHPIPITTTAENNSPSDESTARYNIKARIPKTVYYRPIKVPSYPVPSVIKRNSPEYFDLPPEVANEDFNELVTETDAPIVSLTLNKANNADYAALVNKPFKGVKLIGVTRGDNPSCHFQVLTPFGFAVFIQSDIFMEAILRDGLNPETKELNSEFVFATIRNTTKLIRVNSALHRACMEKQQLMSRPKIDIKTMNVGEVYQKKGGQQSIFLGFVSTVSPTGTFRKDLAMQLPVKYRESKLMTLWWNCDGWNRGDEELKTNKNYFVSMCIPPGRLGQEKYIPYQLALRPQSGHQFINQVKGIRQNIPEDIIFQIKRAAISSVKPFLSRQKSDFWELRRMRNLEKMINMTVFGMKPEIHEVCEKIQQRNKEYFEEYGKSSE